MEEKHWYTKAQVNPVGKTLSKVEIMRKVKNVEKKIAANSKKNVALYKEIKGLLKLLWN